MRIAGALLLAIGLMLATGVALYPAHASVLGTSVSCGLPVVAAFNHAQDSAGADGAIAQECRAESFPRLLIAVVLYVISVVGGVLMIALGGSRPSPPAWPRP